MCLKDNARYPPANSVAYKRINPGGWGLQGLKKWVPSHLPSNAMTT